MAHTYTITSMGHPSNAVGDFLWSISGTVDGTAVSITVWNSVLQPNMATAIAFQNFISPLLLAAYNAQLPPTTANPPISNWTQ